MNAHSKPRRNVRSKSLPESLFRPPRPQSNGEARIWFRGSEVLGLEVQGFCCPLQQRPSSVSKAHRVTPQSRGGGHGSLPLLSSLKGRLESGAKLASTSRTRSRPKITPDGASPTVWHQRDPVSERTETPTIPCYNKRQAPHGHAGAAKVSELHLYLPSSLCDDEEQDTETQEMRTSAEETRTVPTLHTPDKTSLTQDKALHGTPSPDITQEDVEYGGQQSR